MPETSHATPNSLDDCIKRAQENCDQLELEINKLKKTQKEDINPFKQNLYQIFVDHYLFSTFAWSRATDFRDSVSDQNAQLDHEISELERRIAGHPCVNSPDCVALRDAGNKMYQDIKDVRTKTSDQIQQEWITLFNLFQVLNSSYQHFTLVGQCLSGAKRRSSKKHDEKSYELLLQCLESCSNAYKNLLTTFKPPASESSPSEINDTEAPHTPAAQDTLVGVANGDSPPSAMNSPLRRRRPPGRRNYTSPTLNTQLSSLKSHEVQAAQEAHAGQETWSSQVRQLEIDYERLENKLKTAFEEIGKLNSTIEGLEVAKQALEGRYNDRGENYRKLQAQRKQERLQAQESENNWKAYHTESEKLKTTLEEELKSANKSCDEIREKLQDALIEQKELIAQRNRYYDAMKQSVIQHQAQLGNTPPPDDEIDYFDEFAKQRDSLISHREVVHSRTSSEDSTDSTGSGALLETAKNIQSVVAKLHKGIKSIQKDVNEMKKNRIAHNAEEQRAMQQHALEAQGLRLECEVGDLYTRVTGLEHIAQREAVHKVAREFITYTRRVLEHLPYLSKPLILSVAEAFECHWDGYGLHETHDALAQELSDALNNIRKLCNNEVVDEAPTGSKDCLNTQSFSLFGLKEPLKYTQAQLQCTIVPHKRSQSMKLFFTAPVSKKKSSKETVLDECTLWCMRILIDIIEPQLHKLESKFTVKFGVAADGSKETVMQLQKYLSAYVALYNKLRNKDLCFEIDEGWAVPSQEEMTRVQQEILCWPPEFFTACGSEVEDNCLIPAPGAGIVC